MSLFVEVWVGRNGDDRYRKKLGEIVLHNVSDLADISDYEGYIEEYGSNLLNISDYFEEVKIDNYPRKQSVWNLVRKVLNGKMGFDKG